jgi:hypothetical protein
MNTASRSSGTRLPQCWLTSYGKPEAVPRDRRRRTGFRLCKTCEPVRKFKKSDGRADAELFRGHLLRRCAKPMSLEITCRTVDGIQVVDLKGRLTIGQEDLDFRAELDKLVAAGKLRVALNFSDVSKLDTTGLGTLLFALAKLRKALYCHAARPDFLSPVRDFTGNVPGEGGLITFADSAWLASIVLPHQPHFIGQPEDVEVFWGYGLHVDKPGDFVKKPMSACTGREILTGDSGPPAHRREAAQILRDLDLHSLHDAIHHQPVPNAGKGRSSPVVPSGTSQIWLSPASFANFPMTSCLPWNTPSAAPPRPSTTCLSWTANHQPSTKGNTIRAFLFKAFKTLHEMTV